MPWSSTTKRYCSVLPLEWTELCLKSAGKLFHTQGLQAEKLLSAKVLYVHGMKHVLSQAERRFWQFVRFLPKRKAFFICMCLLICSSGPQHIELQSCRFFCTQTTVRGTWAKISNTSFWVSLPIRLWVSYWASWYVSSYQHCLERTYQWHTVCHMYCGCC